MYEIIVQYQLDQTNVFVCVRNSIKQVAIVATGAFETWNDANVATYAIDVTEAGGGGTYYANFPTSITVAGTYTIPVYQGPKDGSATPFGRAGTIIWDGTAEITISNDIANIKAKTDNLPSDPADQSALMNELDNIGASVDSLYDFNPETESVSIRSDGLDIISLSSGDINSLKNTVDTNLDVTVSSRSNHTAANVKTALETDGSKLDHLWETTEDDDGVRRFTENALEQAPTAEMDQDELHAALNAYVAAGGDFDAIKKLLRADKVIDTAETPWVTDYKEEGTENILMSKTMKNTEGESIGNVNNVLGRLEKE